MPSVSPHDGHADARKRYIQAMLGHVKLETTAIYAQAKQALTYLLQSLTLQAIYQAAMLAQHLIQELIKQPVGEFFQR